MTDLAMQYGIAGVALMLAAILAHLLWQQQQRQRQVATGGADAPARRCELKDLHDDVRAVRAVVESVKDLLQAQVTKLAVLEYRMAELERRMNEAHVGE